MAVPWHGVSTLILESGGETTAILITAIVRLLIPPSGLTPTNTTDGSCGKGKGNTVCGSWKDGNCCSRLVPSRGQCIRMYVFANGSSSGWCGSGDAYCGSGCQSGDCVSGGKTQDGTCGSAHKDMVCGDFPQGGCCSAAGWCGRTKAHCGDGCQSGPCGWKSFTNQVAVKCTYEASGSNSYCT